MSYILDAIKQAERQRQQDQIPILQSVISNQADNNVSVSSRKLIVVSVLIGMLLLAVWFRVPITQVITDENYGFLSWMAVGEGQREDQSEDQSEDQNRNQDLAKDPDKDQPDKDQNETLSHKSSNIELSKTKVDSEPAISEAQKLQLQSIKLSVISYSKNPTKRFVMNGDNLLREGDEIKGFTINAIKQNSIVVEVGNQNFRIKF